MLSSIYVLVPQCLFPAFSIIIISEYMSLSPLGSGTSLGICTHIISFNITFIEADDDYQSLLGFIIHP